MRVKARDTCLCQPVPQVPPSWFRGEASKKRSVIKLLSGHFRAEACFSKVSRTFRARKATFQTAIRLFSNGDLLTFFFNVRETKRITKFNGLEPRRCEDTMKGFVAPEKRAKSCGTFEKQAPGPSY